MEELKKLGQCINNVVETCGFYDIIDDKKYCAAFFFLLIAYL